MRHIQLILTLGFVIFCVGGVARTYMNIRLNGWNLLRVTKSGSTERNYRQLVNERGAPAWPLFVSVPCILIGIILIFGAIIWTTRGRLN